MPALLHAGEFVLRPEAVNRIGRGALDRMNSGAGGEVHNNFYIHAVDAKSFEQLLDRGGAAKIMRALRRGDNDGHWSFRG